MGTSGLMIRETEVDVDEESEFAHSSEHFAAQAVKDLFTAKKPKTVAIFTHAGPDPDGLGSMMGMGWLAGKYGCDVRYYSTGSISHPQNRAFRNLLGIDPEPADTFDNADLVILVDTCPQNAGCNKERPPIFDLVIDHHRNTPGSDFEGVFVNLGAGSSCGTVYTLLEEMGFSFGDSSNDVAVATALVVGISTDTENLMSDDTTEFEFRAFSNLFSHRDPMILKQIIHYERPKFWVEAKAAATSKVRVEETVGVVGMGLIPSRHRDVIADMADEMVKWEDINTAVVFAVVDGKTVEGSVRTKTASVSAPSLCQALGGKYGGGGGKLGKGAYKYEMAGVSIDDDEEDDVKAAVWNCINVKEINRIFRVMKHE